MEKLRSASTIATFWHTAVEMCDGLFCFPPRGLPDDLPFSPFCVAPVPGFERPVPVLKTPFFGFERLIPVLNAFLGVERPIPMLNSLVFVFNWLIH